MSGTFIAASVAVVVVAIVLALLITQARRNRVVTRRPGYLIGGPTDMARPTDPRLPR